MKVMPAIMTFRDGSAPGGTIVPATEDSTSARMLTYAINALQCQMGTVPLDSWIWKTSPQRQQQTMGRGIEHADVLPEMGPAGHCAVCRATQDMRRVRSLTPC